MALLRKKNDFLSSVSASSGWRAFQNDFRVSSSCGQQVRASACHVVVFIVLLAAEVARRRLRACPCCSLLEPFFHWALWNQWYWLLSDKCLVGTNRTRQWAPTLCTLYGEPSVSCRFSAKGRSNSHSSLTTQVTGFGVLPKIRQAPQSVVYEE